MATNGKAWAHGSATHPTRVVRNLLSAIMGQPTASHANSATATTRGGSYGVVGGGDFLVTSTGSLGYSVAAGRLVCPGTFALAQGGYAGYNDAAVTGNVGARDATNPRIDYIAYRVRDTDEDATGSEDDGIVVIAGTPAGSPSAPSVPSSLGSLVILSEVTVPSVANGGALTFTDRRQYASAIGGIIRCTSTTRPTGAALWEGQYIDEMNTDRTWRYSGSAWQPVKGSFCCIASASTSIGAGVTTGISGFAEAEDTDNFYPGSGSTFTIPAGLGGKYTVSFWVNTLTPISSPGAIWIFQSATAVGIQQIPTGTGNATVCFTRRANAGDTFSFQIQNGHSATLTYTCVADITRVSD